MQCVTACMQSIPACRQTVTTNLPYFGFGGSSKVGRGKAMVTEPPMG
ncbi:MAG: hypothetical protein QOJ16_1852 [Acidobacteriota bacterium]|jgi:hypothetical protein|nr:hypothetical protein [Acidobacteriota bacterium]